MITAAEPLRWIAAIGLLLPLAAAAAQDTYVLTEQDAWTANAPIDPATPDGQLAAARRALAAEEFDRAANLASRWLERYPRDVLAPDAYLIRGDALTGQDDEYEALFDYELIARSFPASDVFVTAHERELQIARTYIHGRNRKLWGMRIVNATDDAEEILIRIQERMPGSRVAEDAGIELADYYFRERKMDLAVDAYALFIENYPRSPYVSVARQRLIGAHLAAFKGPQFDATGLYEARDELRRLSNIEPVTAQQVGAAGLLTRIAESDAQKMLTTARWYLKVDDVISAEFVLQRLIRAYPASVAASEAQQLIPQLIPLLPPSVINRMPQAGAAAPGDAATKADSPAPEPVPAEERDR